MSWLTRPQLALGYAGMERAGEVRLGLTGPSSGCWNYRLTPSPELWAEHSSIPES